MKKRLYSILFVPMLLLAMVRCGDDAKCGGEHAGIWEGTSRADVLVLQEDCGFSYTGIGCRSEGVYVAEDSASGTARVEITSSNGGQCLPAGSYACAYGVTNSLLTFSCGYGTATYRKS